MPSKISVEKQSPAFDPINWHTLATDQVVNKLNVLPSQGLSSPEAQERLRLHGANKLVEAPPTTVWKMLWDQFNDFVVMLLIVAAVISAILNDWVEAIVIMAIVILNAVLGVFQERRAEEALAALKKLAAPEANTLRNGHRISIPAHELVPGDIVFLESGNYIPADVRMLKTANLKVDEATLTGESVPSKKEAQTQLPSDSSIGDQENMTFMGTIVTYGRGTGVVVYTGMKTQIGKIAAMLQSVEQEQTPLQKRLDQLGHTLGWAALAVSGLVFVLGWMRGSPPLEIFIIAVSLAIAAVPEGLPAVVTISLALGMREMIKRNALIRRLSSVETLGSATVICSDKTGTLTQNEMTVTRVAVDGEFIDVTGSGYTPKGEFFHEGKLINLTEFPAIHTALWLGALNNDAILEILELEQGEKNYRMIGDPTEGALMVAAAKAGAELNPLLDAYPRIEEVPFDSDRKRMLTVHRIHDPRPEDLSPFYDNKAHNAIVVAVKGAPDIVLQKCSHYQNRNDQAVPLDDEQRHRILAANDSMTQEALRVLGVAFRVTQQINDENDVEARSNELEKGLIFVGLIGMIDPARPEVPQALTIARKAGIRTVMITGDYPNTARAIAEDIGLMQSGPNVLTGKDIDALSDETLQSKAAKTDVFARVSPTHKMRVVNALRANGEVVAMTGDGVNDAPSIKQADIGVAMGITGTDVTKETADMVLTDDNYASIVSAVEQGRVIYSNIRKFVYYLISCNLAEIAIIFIATLMDKPSPLTAIQLLWLNLITDGAPALALGVEKGDPDIMDRPPRSPSEPIINHRMRTGIIIQTIAITAITLTAYFWGLNTHPESPELARTMAFVALSFSELLRAFTARSEYYPILKVGVFSNRSMNWAVMSSLVLLLAVIYVPFFQDIFSTTMLGWMHWKILVPLLFIPAFAAEATKSYLSKKTKLA